MCDDVCISFYTRLASLQPLVLAALLAAYAGIDARALKLGVVFRYWAKVHASTHMQYGVPVLGQGTVYT